VLETDCLNDDDDELYAVGMNAGDAKRSGWMNADKR
jgi:hypothetical protein